MVKKVLALSAMTIAVVFAQGGRGGRGGPPPPAEPGTAKERQLWAYDVKIPANYVVPKTPWGEPDLQGIWPINHLIQVPLTRQKQYGDRLYKTDTEFGAPGRGGRAAAAVPVADSSTI